MNNLALESLSSDLCNSLQIYDKIILMFSIEISELSKKFDSDFLNMKFFITQDQFNAIASYYRERKQ